MASMGEQPRYALHSFVSPSSEISEITEITSAYCKAGLTFQDLPSNDDDLTYLM